MATPWLAVRQASKRQQQGFERGIWWTWRLLVLLSLWQLAPILCLSRVSKAGRRAVFSSRRWAASRALLRCSLGRGAPVLLKHMPQGRTWLGAKVLQGEYSKDLRQLCYPTPLQRRPLQGQPGECTVASGLQGQSISAAERTAPLRVQPAHVVSLHLPAASLPACGSGGALTGQMTSHSVPGYIREQQQQHFLWAQWGSSLCRQCYHQATAHRHKLCSCQALAASIRSWSLLWLS